MPDNRNIIKRNNRMVKYLSNSKRCGIKHFFRVTNLTQ